MVYNNGKYSTSRGLLLGWSAAVLLSVSVFARIVGATTGGSVCGTMTDRSGAVIANANVTVRDVDRSVERTAATNEAGFYAFTFLPVGKYEIKIESSGFRLYRRAGLVIDIGSVLQVNATVEVGEHADQVTVTEQGTEVETTEFATAKCGGHERSDKHAANRRSQPGQHVGQWSTRKLEWFPQ